MPVAPTVSAYSTATAARASLPALMEPMTAESVILRLEEAGRTLLSLPNTGPSTRLVQSGMEWVRDAADTGGAMAAASVRVKLRPAVPSAQEITRMDEALAWILTIPLDRYVLRRVVGARSLVSPMTGRHLYTWRRLGVALGADHKAVQRWHGQGVARVVAALRAGSLKAGALKVGGLQAGRGSDAGRHPGVAQATGHHRGGQA